MHLHLLLICFQGPSGETTPGVSVTGGSSQSATATSPIATAFTSGSGASTQPTGIVRIIGSPLEHI